MTTTSMVDAQAHSEDASQPLRLSFSRVDTYQQCPLRFRYAYLDKLPAEPNPHLSWGTSVHRAIETWWNQKLPSAPPVEILLQALYDCWDDSGFEGMAREDKIAWYRHAQDVLRRHHARYAPSFVPAVASEEWFALNLAPDLEVVGSVDHVARTATGGIGIVDWKTGKRAKTRQEVRDSLQLAIYTIAAVELWGHEPEWVALDFVVPGVRVTVPREEIDTEWALTKIFEVADRVRAEAFPPSPSRLCDWCDYRSLCPAFDGDGPDIAARAVVELDRLRRRRERDEARIGELEHLIRDRLGPAVVLEVGQMPGLDEGVGR